MRNPKLSDREIQVLKMVVHGATTKTISKSLGITPRTVGNHRENITRKTGYNSAVLLVHFAIHNRIVNVRPLRYDPKPEEPLP